MLTVRYFAGARAAAGGIPTETVTADAALRRSPFAIGQGSTSRLTVLYFAAARTAAGGIPTKAATSGTTLPRLPITAEAPPC